MKNMLEAVIAALSPTSVSNILLLLLPPVGDDFVREDGASLVTIQAAAVGRCGVQKRCKSRLRPPPSHLDRGVVERFDRIVCAVNGETEKVLQLLPQFVAAFGAPAFGGPTPPLPWARECCCRCLQRSLVLPLLPRAQERSCDAAFQARRSRARMRCENWLAHKPLRSIAWVGIGGGWFSLQGGNRPRHRSTSKSKNQKIS